MTTLLSSVGRLSLTFSNYLPLIVVCVALGLLFLILRLAGVTARLVWKLLINGLIGAGMLCVFDIIFSAILGLDFFYIPVTWFTSTVSGILGIPGVILLLALKFVLPLP